VSKLRCAVLDDYQNVALTMADWSLVSQSVEVQAFDTHISATDDLVRALEDFEIVVAMRERTRLDAGTIARLPKLRLLLTSGMRNSAIDLDAARRHNVVVCGTHSMSEPPVELTWALILGLARNVVAETRSFRHGGPWQSTIGTDLHGSTLGVLGLGKIGTRVARVGQSFGMDVVAWSQNLTQDRVDAVGVRLAASKDALLEVSDFLTIHLVLSDRSRGLIGQKDLRRMKPTGYLVNTSRAGIVDEAALVRALQERWIAGAGLDVYSQEPLPQNHVLRDLPNVLGTPHLGYVTAGNYRMYFQEAVEDIAAYLAGQPIRLLS
jgi:phosphoglycerate dehydrogenase-like enzyme